MRHLKEQTYKHIQNVNYFIQKKVHNLTIEFLAKLFLILYFLAVVGGNIYNLIFLTSEDKST